MEVTTQQDLHFDAFTWKAELHSLCQSLDSCSQRLLEIEDSNVKIEHQQFTERLKQEIEDVMEKIAYIGQRIAQFENKLAIYVECYVSCCERLFYGEFEIIQKALQKLNMMVGTIESELNSSTTN